jgi:raffinose/stachyose/melibiose transport system permease protein
MRFRGSGVLFVIFLIGLLMPFEATIVPLYYDLRSVGLANTYAGLILPETALFLSFGTFWMRANFMSSERSLVEAARLDGANSWTTLWRVLVPNSLPAITTMMVLFFIWSWNEFLLALVLAQDPEVQTAPAGLGLFSGQHTTDISGLAAAAIIMTIPALIVYVLLQRHFIRGVTSGGVKG